jgi:hypothetical protein
MCCQIINDLLDRKLRASKTDICEAIILALKAHSSSRSIRGGVFDTLCETAIHLSKSNNKNFEKFKSLHVRKIIGEYDNSLSPERISELYMMQIKFSSNHFL